MSESLVKGLQVSVVEKDVENAYRKAIIDGRPHATVTSPYHTDGYAQWDTVRLLLEAKYDLDFKQRVPVCNTLGQCLMYIKRFEESGEPLPNVILVGDKNECFVLSTAAVKGFLDLPIDWSGAPSSGNPDLTRALVESMNILPYVYDVDGNFKFKEVLAKIEILAAGEQYTVRANLGNIGAIFLYWKDRVFTGSNLTPVEQADVFLRCLFQPTEVYLHPTKKGVLVVPGYTEGVPVNTEQYRSFFDHFQQGYKPSEIEVFYSMKDRLIEDDARRRQGAFFTPTPWVDKAHEYISTVLGPDWRKDCIVWDNSCGTGNLTRDYEFSDLILTTAEKSDVEVIKEQGYNPGALIQQYDFLNPEVTSPFLPGVKNNALDDAIVLRLRAAAQAGKRLVILMNPPYGTAGNLKLTEEKKTGLATTSTATSMKDAKLGACSQQLYAQFMFESVRMVERYGFKDCTIALFSIPTFMCSGSYRPFRNFWYGKHHFESGFLFQASNFADVSSRWGISFSIWNFGGTTDSTQDLMFDILEPNEKTFNIDRTGTKAFYNSDGREASKWVRELVKGLKGVDAPQFASGLKIKEKGRGFYLANSLGYFGNDSNNVTYNDTLVYFMSSADTHSHGCLIAPPNFSRAIALYSARKLVLETWDNQKDEYLIPDTVNPDYEQWVRDCQVYILLHRSNNCTSMRGVPYKNLQWDIHNHFFWKTHADTLKALDTSTTTALYRDCKNHPAKDVFGNDVASTPDPYMSTQLTNLSPDAQHVLDLLNALWVKSLPLRESYAAGRPELHLLSWDAGVYQLKHLWRDLFPDEWGELQKAYKALAERLRPGVYTFGFLKP